MADAEKIAPPNEDIQSPTHSFDNGEVDIPKGWMYKSFKIGRFTLPWYASPESQLILVAFVCFLCPGKRS